MLASAARPWLRRRSGPETLGSTALETQRCQLRWIGRARAGVLLGLLQGGEHCRPVGQERDLACRCGALRLGPVGSGLLGRSLAYGQALTTIFIFRRCTAGPVDRRSAQSWFQPARHWSSVIAMPISVHLTQEQTPATGGAKPRSHPKFTCSIRCSTPTHNFVDCFLGLVR